MAVKIRTPLVFSNSQFILKVRSQYTSDQYRTIQEEWGGCGIRAVCRAECNPALHTAKDKIIP